MKTFQINSLSDIFYIEAKYFNTDETGVIFYDEDDKRVGFAPLQSVIIKIDVVKD